MTDLDLDPTRPGHHDLRRHRRCRGRRRRCSMPPGRGITHIDTANGYAGGESEKILAELLRRPARRGHPRHQGRYATPRRRRPTRRCRRGLAGQRRGQPAPPRHRPRRPVLSAPARPRGRRWTKPLSTVAELVAEGKIGALGVSNFAAWQIAEVNHVADEVGAPRPVVAQQLYNLLARRIEEEYAEFAAVTDLITMVYNPLGGGLLTGRHPSTPAPPKAGSVTPDWPRCTSERYWNTADIRCHRPTGTSPTKPACPLTELALRWLRPNRRPDPSCWAAPKSPPADQHRRHRRRPAPRRPGRRVRRHRRRPARPHARLQPIRNTPHDLERIRLPPAQPRTHRRLLVGAGLPRGHRMDRPRRLGLHRTGPPARPDRLLGHAAGLTAIDAAHGPRRHGPRRSQQPHPDRPCPRCGRAGVIVPLINTAAEAAAAVAAATYPPTGIRSYGPMRSQLRIGPDTRRRQQRHRRAGDDRDSARPGERRKICATDGLDGVYVGPSDLR